MAESDGFQFADARRDALPRSSSQPPTELPSPPDHDQPSTRTAIWPLSPLQWLAAACVLGVLLGHLNPPAVLSLATAACLLTAIGTLTLSLSRGRGIRSLALVATVLSGAAFVVATAAWTTLRLHHAPPMHAAAMLRDEPTLVRVAGRVDGPIRLVSRQQGALGQFTPQTPGTRFGLTLTGVEENGRWMSAAGRVLVTIDEVDPRIAAGQRIVADGWLGPFRAPSNPGPVDYRPIMRRQGVDGSLMLTSAANWRELESSLSPWDMLSRWRATAAAATRDALHLGMEDSGRAGDLLDALLLGVRSGDMRELTQTFRRVGLAHVLAISGAHLAILIGLTWAVVRLFVPRPPRAALLVLAVLLLYLMAVPPRVPIVRAGIMAGAYCAAFALGRQWRPLDPLAIALVLVLLWRPADIADGGFQLSFGIVAGLIVFAPRLHDRLTRSNVYVAATDPTRRLLLYAIGGYGLMNIVAFSLALPLVAFHFEMICPLTILLGLLALPAMTALLGLGYLKIAIGLLSPTLGALLAGPLVWLADTVAGLVTHAAAWPGVMIDLPQPVPVLWTLVTLTIILATLAGPLLRRPALMTVLLLACAAWLALMQRPPHTVVLADVPPDPSLRMHTLDVGDGGCHLLRLAGEDGAKPTYLMFDAGSQNIPDPAHAVILPVLRRLGVRHLDVLVISHANLDHFNAVIDLADNLHLREIWLTPQFLDATAGRTGENASSDYVDPLTEPAALLLSLMHEREIPITTISRGFTRRLGPSRAECLWPPRDWPAAPRNDSSAVLRLTVGKRRVMLSGDVEVNAIARLVQFAPDLQADIADLPHHGSVTSASAVWLDAVRPTILLQSTTPRRLRRDLWPQLLERHTTAAARPRRLVTAGEGLVELIVDSDGVIHAGAYRELTR